MKKRLLVNEAETLAFGNALAKDLSSGAIVALHGDLGAGKTTLAKGIVGALTGIDIREIVSPTFTYLQLYEPAICHFDLYRLKNASQFVDMGFCDYFDGQTICLIEWAERISDLLPSQTVHINLIYDDENQRAVYVS